MSNIKPFMPVHPLRAGYDRALPAGSVADAYQRRLEPANFNPTYLSELAGRLQEAHDKDPEDEEVRTMLATVILQNRATAHGVTTAFRLTADLEGAAGRVNHLAASIMERQGEQEKEERMIVRTNWSVHNKCPMTCRGCYNPFSDQQVTIDQARRIADQLAQHQVEGVVLSGGDPLLWPDIYQLVEYTVSVGIATALDTTGYTLTRDSLEKLRGLSSLRLPLDGTTPKVQRAFRRSADANLVNRFIRSLDLCEAAEFNKVRVHTVASKANLHDLTNIAETIFARDCVKQWVIFQWWGRRSTTELTGELQAEAQELEGLVDTIRATYPGKDITLATAESRAFINFMIQSSGQVVTFASGPEEEFIIGDLTTETLGTILARPVLDTQANRRGMSVKINN